MGQLLISQYLNQLAQLKKISGAKRESVIREAFKDLLKSWGEPPRDSRRLFDLSYAAISVASCIA